MIRRFLALLAVSATAAAGLLALRVTAPDPQAAGIEPAAAANAANWNPGNIISDENFYNGRAMSAPEVQAFLESKNSSSSSTALRNYRQNTPNISADRYCAAYQGSGSESAAEIITKVGEACNFSQQAMLVLLEKEQSLLTLSSPSAGRLAAATGFGCPDTAPCDSSVGGFFYQVYYAARQFNVYKANPYSFNHIPFATNNVLYNPNFSCGSSPVFIENYATAGLYNYTPYQPNRAALNNLYGTGDGCSAYGNRNFWWMYSDWFGDPHGAASSSAGPTLIQAQGENELFLLSEGTRYYIAPDMADRYKAAFGEVETIPTQGMSWIPWGPWASEFLTGPDETAYYLTADGKIYQFRNCHVAAAFGGSCEGTAKITAAQAAVPESLGMLESFVRTQSGHLLLIQDGTKREVSNLDVLTAMGLFTRTTEGVDDAIVADLPYGAPIISSGGVVAGEGGQAPLFIDSAHVGHEVPASMAELPGLKTTTTFSADSYALIQLGAKLAPLMTDGSRSYLATTDGLLQVSAAQYGGGVRFEPVSSETIAALPQAGSALGAHFVKMGADGKIQLIAGGERFELADQAAADKEAAKRGIDAKVYTTVDGAIAGVTTGNGIVNGSVLKPQGSEDLYILDGMHLQPVANLEIAQALGFTQAPITITTASFDNIAKRDTVLDGTQVTCNGVTGFAVNGAIRPYANAALQAAYGLESQPLSNELCALIPVSGERMSDVLKTPDGTIWWVSGGEKRPIGWPSIGNNMGAYDRVVEVSEYVAAQLPTGEYLLSVPEGYAPPVDEPVDTPEPTVPPATETPTATPEPTVDPTTTATETPDATATPEPTGSASTTPTPTETAEPAVPLENGDVITDARGSGIWIVNGEQLLQVGSPEVAAALGLDIVSPLEVPQANFDAFAGKTAPLYSSAVRCDGVDYIGIGGELVPYESAEVAAAYGLTHVELAAEVCAPLQPSARTLGTEVLLPNGNTYVVENGTLRLKGAAGFTATPGATAEAAVDASATPGADATAPADSDGNANADGDAATEPTASTEDPTATEPGATEPDSTEPTATDANEGQPTVTSTPQPDLLTLPIEVVSAMKRGEPIA